MISDELMIQADASACAYDDLVAEFDDVSVSVFVSVAFHLLQFFGDWMDD
jgi:hypothetical protein